MRTLFWKILSILMVVFFNCAGICLYTERAGNGFLPDDYHGHTTGNRHTNHHADPASPSAIG